MRNAQRMRTVRTGISRGTTGCYNLFAEDSQRRAALNKVIKVKVIKVLIHLHGRASFGIDVIHYTPDGGICQGVFENFRKICVKMGIYAGEWFGTRAVHGKEEGVCASAMPTGAPGVPGRTTQQKERVEHVFVLDSLRPGCCRAAAGLLPGYCRASVRPMITLQILRTSAPAPRRWNLPRQTTHG